MNQLVKTRDIDKMNNYNMLISVYNERLAFRKEIFNHNQYFDVEKQIKNLECQLTKIIEKRKILLEKIGKENWKDETESKKGSERYLE